MGAPRISSLHTILGPPDHFLRLLYGAPQISFFSYNMGPLLDQFHCLLYAPPPIKSVSLHAIGWPPQILVFSQSIWGPPQISFSAYYMGPLRLVSLLTIWGPLRSVSVHTFWGPPLRSVFFSYYMGPPQISFFAYYMGGPSDQFLHLLYGGPLRSVSSLVI